MSKHNQLLTRRSWLSKVAKGMVGIGLFLIIPCVKLSQSVEIIPIPEKKDSIGATFENETMTFTAGFFIFPQAGDAVIKLTRLSGEGRYRGIITGKTRGVIAFLTRHREDTHISELKENKEKNRFICTKLIRDTKIGKDHTVKIFEMDYEKRQMTVTRIKRKRKSVHIKPIPPGIIYDDPLTAFYNFRFGSYGPVRYGNRYKIDTIPGKKVKHIFLKVASKEETEQKKEELSFFRPGEISFLSSDRSGYHQVKKGGNRGVDNFRTHSPLWCSQRCHLFWRRKGKTRSLHERTASSTSLVKDGILFDPFFQLLDRTLCCATVFLKHPKAFFPDLSSPFRVSQKA